MRILNQEKSLLKRKKPKLSKSLTLYVKFTWVHATSITSLKATNKMIQDVKDI